MTFDEALQQAVGHELRLAERRFDQARVALGAEPPVGPLGQIMATLHAIREAIGLQQRVSDDIVAMRLRASHGYMTTADPARFILPPLRCMS